MTLQNQNSIITLHCANQRQKWRSLTEKEVCFAHHRKSSPIPHSDLTDKQAAIRLWRAHPSTLSLQILQNLRARERKELPATIWRHVFPSINKTEACCRADAAEAWEGFQIAGETVQKMERVLDVRARNACWVVVDIYGHAIETYILEIFQRCEFFQSPGLRLC